MAMVSVETGDKYGRLSVIKEVSPYISPSGRRARRVLCLCDCGKRTSVVLNDLRRENTKSCGCLQLDAMAMNASHGHSRNRRRTKTYQAWLAMKQRCCNANHKWYPSYGGSGITVCEQWMASFEAFLMDMGECPPKLTLDRIDNSGNYEPKNCRWATPREQTLNRSTTHWITFNGERKCMSDWAKSTGITSQTLYGRLKRGWTMEKALTTPVNKRVG